MLVKYFDSRKMIFDSLEIMVSPHLSKTSKIRPISHKKFFNQISIETICDTPPPIPKG